MSILCMCLLAVSEQCLAIWVVNTTTTGIICSPSHRRLPDLGLFALCLAWQQCEVNRMNKTYLNQNPPPWEMSSCQYSLMGKHKFCPWGRAVYPVATTVSLYVGIAQDLREHFFSFSNYFCLRIVLYNGISIQPFSLEAKIFSFSLRDSLSTGALQCEKLVCTHDTANRFGWKTSSKLHMVRVYHSAGLLLKKNYCLTRITTHITQHSSQLLVAVANPYS